MTKKVKQGKLILMPTLANNQRAYFDYEIKDTFVAGLVLTGAEVKSVKNGNVSLLGAYVTTANNSVNLINAHIGAYKYAHQTGYNPTQTRQLLLQQKEINELLGKEKGLVIVPLEIFTTPKGWLKIKLGIGKAKKQTDKRETIKKRDMDRDIRRSY